MFEQQLQDKYLETILNDKYKYYHASNLQNYTLELDNDTWNKIDFVSVNDEGEVLGYLFARFDRTADLVSGLGAMNFGEINYQFSKDFHKFITDLLMVHNFRKINFSVVVGNPAERMYDKYITKYGGRIVGTFKEDVRLYDGKYYDHKYYEIFKDNFLASSKTK